LARCRTDQDGSNKDWQGGKSVQFADPFRQIASYSPQTIGKLASISHRLATLA
jgi:hypothetical protein